MWIFSTIHSILELTSTTIPDETTQTTNNDMNYIPFTALSRDKNFQEEISTSCMYYLAIKLPGRRPFSVTVSNFQEEIPF